MIGIGGLSPRIGDPRPRIRFGAGNRGMFPGGVLT